ncbi:hypothetical protein ANN_10100 [Periplaneta americana]|uniref:Uncharacterized protein n=1 Tax=Periplaneta americana TaxID=6978 RepID=A0ABQ8TP56_PERAM|nr:hypothetical protein ANN_10100 [Periplaneta americana]
MVGLWAGCLLRGYLPRYNLTDRLDTATCTHTLLSTDVHIRIDHVRYTLRYLHCFSVVSCIHPSDCALNGILFYQKFKDTPSKEMLHSFHIYVKVGLVDAVGIALVFYARLMSRAVASRSKASCLGLALRNARWFESSWGRNFLMKFRSVYGTGAHAAS